jgi:zinc protease
VALRTSLSRWPVEKASMQIRYDSDPDRVSELKGLVYAELDKLAGDGPSEVDLSKTIENILKGREESKEHNAYYSGILYNYYVHGINFDDPANYEDILTNLTAKDVKKVMKAFYNHPNIVDVVFVPLEEDSTGQ